MNLELPVGANEATARGLADLVAYEEEAMARFNVGEAPPAIDEFLAELRQDSRPIEVVTPDAEWVGNLDTYYKNFAAALSK
jgi:hypothetical protein